MLNDGEYDLSHGIDTQMLVEPIPLSYSPISSFLSDETSMPLTPPRYSTAMRTRTGEISRVMFGDLFKF